MSTTNVRMRKWIMMKVDDKKVAESQRSYQLWAFVQSLLFETERKIR